MFVFRLSRAPYARPLSGKGAAIKGARWNSPGVEMIYTAANRSLAMAEVAVHFSLATLPDDYVMLTIEIPDDIRIAEIDENILPENWRDFPHPEETRKFGDQFIFERKSAVLKMPSVVTKGDFNYLVNPYHLDFERINIVAEEPFPFDERIFKI